MDVTAIAVALGECMLRASVHRVEASTVRNYLVEPPQRSAHPRETQTGPNHAGLDGAG
mgnify:CR=1 FL=1